MNGQTDQTRNIRQQAVSKNIETIVKLEQDDEQRLSSLHKVSHRIGWFVGTVYFVIVQILLVMLWMGWNARGSVRFDPYPFNLLSAVLTLEAVLLTSFVLIRQNAIDQRSERRNHLDLQINLLAEKEASAILHKLDAIADKLGMKFPPNAETSNMVRDTPMESIAHDLKAQKDKHST